MKFGVLGPLMMCTNGIDSLPTAPKQRQLLALLLLNANRFVSTDACVEELWDVNPPRTVIPTLQTYVLQIRKSLAACPEVGSLAAAHKQLVTGRRGYHLVVPSDSLDAMEFERLVKAGRDAMRRDDDAETSQMYRQALDTWRGQALSDVQAGPQLRAQIDSLEEARLSATEQFFEAQLRLGHHQDILSELCLTAAQNPLNENLQAQHMLALYRSGRQVEALNVFHRLRKTLAEDLGLGPSVPVQRLHEAMLSADSSLDLKV